MLAPPQIAASDKEVYAARPMVDGRKVLCNGKVTAWEGPVQEVFAPIFEEGSTETKVMIGTQARFGEEDSLKALDAAVKSWNHGRGEWAQAKPEVRDAKIQELYAALIEKRAEIINVLMWEICKTKADATKEFDRTMEYIQDTLKIYRDTNAADSKVIHSGGVAAQIKRAPVGVMLNLGPFNYPFNETYCTLIPALLMGNSVVMKLPNVGCLAHICTMEIYAKVFPAGVVNFISGAGRTTMPPIISRARWTSSLSSAVRPLPTRCSSSTRRPTASTSASRSTPRTCASSWATLTSPRPSRRPSPAPSRTTASAARRSSC